MKKIKSFIYLDNYKMYSISSQIFSGLTEYILDSKENRSAEIDQQKGKFATGKILADIIERNNSQTEKKFLHDYSYVLFEEALFEDQKVLVVDANNINEALNKVNDYNFIKITGKVLFNDTRTIEEILTKYNDLGYALTLVGEKASIDRTKEEASELLKGIQDRNQKAKGQQLIKSKINVAELAKQKGLQFDKEYLEKLKYLINYGYNEQFEVLLPFKISNETILFSAILNRELLTESEVSITKKYSRETEKEFSIFGMLTQINPEKEKLNIVDSGDGINYSTIKESLLNLIGLFTDVEKSFHGKLKNEFVIDPIAVYREL